MTVLTIDILNQLALTMPPKVSACAYGLFCKDRATAFQIEGETFYVAHWDFWRAVPSRSSKAFSGLWGLPIIDLDLNDAERRRVMLAMIAAMEAAAA